MTVDQMTEGGTYLVTFTASFGHFKGCPREMRGILRGRGCTTGTPPRPYLLMCVRGYAGQFMIGEDSVTDVRSVDPLPAHFEPRVPR
jgi:hypothetical protein